MIVKYLIFIFIFLVNIGNVNIEDAQAATFDDYVKRLAKHPNVVRILEQGTKFEELSYGEMGLPDPILSIGIDNLPINDPAFDRFLPSSKVFGFNQKIPSYSLRKAKSEKKGQISAKHQLIASYTIQRLEAMLASMIVNLDKVKKQESYAQKQLDYYKELEKYFQGRLEAGSGVYWRFSEVDVERSVVESKLNDLQAERDDIETELIRLVEEIPDIPIPEILRINWNGTPEILYPVRIAKEDITIAAKDVDTANAAFEPNYAVNALYKQRESGDKFSGDDWFSVRATISIPLWSKWKQEPKLRAAKAGKRSAKNAYDDIIRLWTRKLNALASKRDAALNNIGVFVERDKAISEMVDAAKRNYEAGEANLNTVLDAQINQLTIKSQLAEQRAKHLTLSAEFNSNIIGEK